MNLFVKYAVSERISVESRFAGSAHGKKPFMWMQSTSLFLDWGCVELAQEF
jgi:hypothetical protein